MLSVGAVRQNLPFGPLVDAGSWTPARIMALNLTDQRASLGGRHVQPSLLTRRCSHEAAIDEPGAAANGARAQLRPLRAWQVCTATRPSPTAGAPSRHPRLVWVVAFEQPLGSQF